MAPAAELDTAGSELIGDEVLGIAPPLNPLDTHARMTASSTPAQAIGTCALCGRPGVKLCWSHIIPSFIGRDLKNGAAEDLRTTERPNLRLQDLDTIRLLCLECERRLSRWERSFERQVYSVRERPSLVVNYDAWMSRFVASLFWRVLRYLELTGKVAFPSPEIREIFQGAEKRWKDFLLGLVPNVGPYELHLIPDNPLERPPRGGSIKGLDPIPNSWSRYWFRSIDAGPFPLLDAQLVMVKIPGMAFFGVARAGSKGKLPFQGTRLAMRRGRIAPKGYELDVSLMNVLFRKARALRVSASSMSDTQKKKIAAAVSRRRAALGDPKRK